MNTKSFLCIERLCKTFADQMVVSDLCLEMRRGEMVSLLGPSGCGKTTTLRMIGGFVKPESGDIVLEGVSLLNVSAEHRPICTVFQSYALFPHMTVLENVVYGLRCHGADRRSARTRAMAMLDTVGLVDLCHQNVSRLSGGQQQRVALARVLVLSPKVLLLDEPFSNLDANLRLQMREEVRSLQNRFNLTTLFVTHDRDEAMALSDRIAVMEDGRIAQIGTPREIYSSPINHYVAGCVGQVNCITIGGKSLLVRPEHVVMSNVPGQFIGEIRAVFFLGQLTRYHIKYENHIIMADVASDFSPALEPHQRVYLRFTHLLATT